VELEVWPQHFRQSENSMAMRRGSKHLLLNELRPEKRALGAAAGTKTSCLATQREQLLCATFWAPEAGETVCGCILHLLRIGVTNLVKEPGLGRGSH